MNIQHADNELHDTHAETLYALPEEDWSDEDWATYEELCREGRAGAYARHLAWCERFPDEGDDLPR